MLENFAYVPWNAMLKMKWSTWVATAYQMFPIPPQPKVAWSDILGSGTHQNDGSYSCHVLARAFRKMYFQAICGRNQFSIKIVLKFFIINRNTLAVIRQLLCIYNKFCTRRKTFARILSAFNVIRIVVTIFWPLFSLHFPLYLDLMIN